MFYYLQLEYSRKHFHATTPFMSPKISDVTRNSFIKGGGGGGVNQTKLINEPLSSNNGLVFVYLFIFFFCTNCINIVKTKQSLFIRKT